MFLIGTLIIDQKLYPRRSRATKDTVEHLVVEVLDVKKAVGKLPQSEVELVKVLKHAMPANAWGKRIEYKFESENRFRILTTSPYPHWDMFEYDSAQSQKGVDIVRF